MKMPLAVHRPAFTRRAAAVACVAALAAVALALPASAQTAIDIGSWRLQQTNSTQTEIFPAGTLIQPGGYLILARYATKTQFEAYYGVTLGSNVTYLTHGGSSTGVPQINGSEIFELFDAASVSIDGPTPILPSTAPAQAFHRDDPEAAPWTSIDTTPTPGYGVEAPDATGSGVVITEANDATVGTNAYYYEFIELYYDVASGGGTNVPPVITGTQHSPPVPTESDSLIVTTTVTDSDGTVASVAVWYRFGTTSYASLAMASTGGDGYRAVIQPLQPNANLDYYIVAQDDLGAQANDPSNAPATVYSVWVQGPAGPGKLILFDHAHGQDAGTEGNWRVDNDYPYPIPAAPTSEADWSGQLSSWAYELFLAGHTIKSNTTALNASLLADVDLLVIVEPQNPFTADEIVAVGEYVRNGGSLFVVAGGIHLKVKGEATPFLAADTVTGLLQIVEQAPEGAQVIYEPEHGFGWVDLLVIVEPQNPFTADEIVAVGEYVRNGGSLFVVANHNASDRDNDGWDSPSIFGGYSVPHISAPVGSDVETFCGAKFGLHFHVKDEGNNSITGTFANVDTDPANPIINGPYGHVSAVIYHVGDVMSLWPTANPDLTNVAGHIWKDGDTGNPEVNIAAWSRYGSGKVMGYGDSSSCADGTDSEPHENNWTEVGSNNRQFFLNATSWLLASDATGVGVGGPPGLGLGLRAAPNPFNPSTRISFTLPASGAVEMAVYDLRGQLVRTLLSGRREAGAQSVSWDGRDEAGRAVASGIYLVRAAGLGVVEFRKIALAK